ncbi:hypothetical protein BGZ94_002777 [Podila epigama]|nr:hypothetical protein BGZ94_002777 [Podila epigama]
MINDSTSHPPPSENSNSIHESPWGNNFASFIQMLGSLSPEERQTLSAALSIPSSSGKLSDPYLSTKPVAQTLKPYARMEEWLTSFKRRDEFFNLNKTCELEDYMDVKQFHRVQHIDYTALPLFGSKDVKIHKNVFRSDQDLATLQTRLAHLTRPIDTAVHAILASNPMEIEDPTLIKITQLRKEALYGEMEIIPPPNPNDRAPLITQQQFIEQERLTCALRKASGQIKGRRGRGCGRGGFSNTGNRYDQETTYSSDNVLEHSANKNGSKTSMVSNTDASSNVAYSDEEESLSHSEEDLNEDDKESADTDNGTISGNDEDENEDGGESDSKEIDVGIEDHQPGRGQLKVVSEPTSEVFAELMKISCQSEVKFDWPEIEDFEEYYKVEFEKYKEKLKGKTTDEIIEYWKADR